MKINYQKIFSWQFLWEILLFSGCLFLAIDITIRLSQAVNEPELVESNQISILYFLIMFIIATVVLLLIIKFVKNPWFLRVIYFIAIAEGLLIFSQAYIISPYYILLALVLFILWIVINNILIHDIVLVIALSAIAVIFGTSIDPVTAIFILLFLAVYDFWAVFKSKHMVKMFSSLVKNKIHFAIIIPEKVNDLFNKVKDAKSGKGIMFLGTGDLAIPAIFVVSTLQQGIAVSILTALGSIFGLIFLFIIFISQVKKQPMPGLPPIVMGAMIGYFISFFI